MFIGHFDLEIYLYSTTYIPLPPSHTTHSVAFLTLPFQKADACVSRGYSCICKTARHFRAICPHHAMSRHHATLRRWFPDKIDLPVGMPLIAGPDGHTISQHQLIQLFGDTIKLTRTTMERPGPTRFSHHTCRVSPEWDTHWRLSHDGDPMLSSGTSKKPHSSSSTSPIRRRPLPTRFPTQLRSLIQKEVQALQYWVFNPMTKVCHV